VPVVQKPVTMASSVPFDFLMVRQMQKACSSPVLPTPFSEDDPLRLKVDAAKNDESALRLLDDLVEKNESTAPSSSSPDSNVLHKALLLRSEIYGRKGDYRRSKRDAERAIVLRPNYVDSYGALSLIESKEGQFGRAEVDLRLGLFVEPKNDLLKKMLAAIRSKDPVHRDVSAKKGTDKKIRDEHQLAGLELVPPLPEVVLAAMTGSIEQLRKMWEPEMRQFRYGRVKNPMMHFPVLGAQRFSSSHDDASGRAADKEMVGRLKKVIDFLYDQGVRLDERDRVGYTAIMHAAGHIPQPELLDYLLTKGADPDLRSCYGTVALMDATMNQNLREIDVLMRYGADPYIADNDGIRPIKLGEKFRQIIAVYERHLKPEMPAKICSRCTEAGTKRCVKCRVVYYCSKRCQQADWPSHKGQCKALCKSHKRVVIERSEGLHSIVDSSDILSATMHNLMSNHLPNFQPQAVTPNLTDLFDVYTEEWKKNGNLLLKIQTARKPGYDSAPDFSASMLAYNEGKAFQCMLDPKKLDGPELISIIRKRGIGSIKAYFWAFMEPGKQELIVITDPVHAAQPW